MSICFIVSSKMLEASEFKYELDLGEPPQKILDWAKTEFGEHPETRCDVLNTFRDMIYERGECTPHRNDDAFLLRFLRARNFVIPRAHRLLVNYYDFKETDAELFEGVNLKNLMKVADYDLINVPTYRDQNGRRIIILKMANWDPEKISVNEMFQINIVLLQSGLLEQRTQILGAVAIFDLGGLTMQQAMKMTPSVAKTFIKITVTCLPLKVMAMHIVNQPWPFSIIFNVMKPLLNERMKENIYLHGDDLKSLHKHIDPKCLPKTYGGVHEHQDYEPWLSYYKSNDVVRKELLSLNYIMDEDENKNDNQ